MSDTPRTEGARPLRPPRGATASRLLALRLRPPVRQEPHGSPPLPLLGRERQRAALMDTGAHGERGKRDAMPMHWTPPNGRRRRERHQPAPSPPPTQNRALGGASVAVMMTAEGAQPANCAA